MKAFVCLHYVYMSIKIGDICYYDRIKKIDNMHRIVTILHNNKEYSLFETEFKKCFISLTKYRKRKLEKIINDNFLF